MEIGDSFTFLIAAANDNQLIGAGGEGQISLDEDFTWTYTPRYCITTYLIYKANETDYILETIGFWSND